MDSLKKISSMHIERLKKEDEEEQWISGEELNTEGESDEEGGGEGKGGKFKTKRRDRTLNLRSHLKSKLAASCGRHSPSKGPPSPPPALMAPTLSITQDPGNAYSETEPISISWKPKRGSIKLPNIDLDTLGKLRSSDVLHNSMAPSDSTITLDTTTRDLDQGPTTSSDVPD